MANVHLGKAFGDLFDLKALVYESFPNFVSDFEALQTYACPMAAVQFAGFVLKVSCICRRAFSTILLTVPFQPAWMAAAA